MQNKSTKRLQKFVTDIYLANVNLLLKFCYKSDFVVVTFYNQCLNYDKTIVGGGANEVTCASSSRHGYHTLADGSSGVLTPFVRTQSVSRGTVPLRTRPSPS